MYSSWGRGLRSPPAPGCKVIAAPAGTPALLVFAAFSANSSFIYRLSQCGCAKPHKLSEETALLARLWASPVSTALSCGSCVRRGFQQQSGMKQAVLLG